MSTESLVHRARWKGAIMPTCPNGHQNPPSELFCRECQAVMPPLTPADRIPDLRWVAAPLPDLPEASTPPPSSSAAEPRREVPPIGDQDEQVKPVPRPLLMRAKRKPWW